MSMHAQYCYAMESFECTLCNYNGMTEFIHSIIFVIYICMVATLGLDNRTADPLLKIKGKVIL